MLSTFRLMETIWNGLDDFVISIQNFLMFTFTIGDVEYTILECLFGAGISVVLAKLIIKALL